jgi:hypothetical protein
MRKCTTDIHVSLRPDYSGTSTWAPAAAMRFEALINRQPSGY